MLPSPFKSRDRRHLQLDPTIVTSAKVVDAAVHGSYELNLEASWTSNAPIAAEDFVYLWERMRDEPGVVDAAGYRLITDVRSRAAGKAVDVVFSQPYPAWKTLFSNLLPAHLLKDAPGSWTGALTNGLPASGGPFRVVSVDRARGEILLTRNDQYWDTPAVLDQLLLRRLGGTALVDGLGVGDVDIALPDPDETLRTALGGLQPPPRIQTAPQPVVTELAFRTDGGPLADTRVRQAIEGLVDRNAVRAAVAPDALPADAFALAPSRTVRRHRAQYPSGRDVAAHLCGLGPRRRRPMAGGGRAVQLIIGAAAERPADVKVAENIAARLKSAGIDTTVVAPPAWAVAQATVRPPTEHQRHPHLGVGHADAQAPSPPPPRGPPPRDHHHLTDPRARRRVSPSTSWSAPAPSAAMSPRTWRRTTAATTRSRPTGRPRARRCPPRARRRCSRCSTN